MTVGAVGGSTQYTGEGAFEFLNYVEHGDPVGNYACTFPVLVESGFLYSNEIQHYGSTTCLGSILGAAPLIAASAAFATGNKAAQAAAFITFAAAARPWPNVRRAGEGRRFLSTSEGAYRHFSSLGMDVDGWNFIRYFKLLKGEAFGSTASFMMCRGRPCSIVEIGRMKKNQLVINGLNGLSMMNRSSSTVSSILQRYQFRKICR